MEPFATVLRRLISALDKVKWPAATVLFLFSISSRAASIKQQKVNSQI
uniref:Uncharacterized protein n=1 Tax=Rhizophora mucronata TaxID=61149 RepID=A0A2P2PVC1_RHIMU